mmetsp:Transcript_23933/g.57048  ORF Transcript_23933/g.57048 Transcript_23933/m.57048 type:complete len:547 (-) Transcript_23933:244-1884(-)
MRTRSRNSEALPVSKDVKDKSDVGFDRNLDKENDFQPPGDGTVAIETNLGDSDGEVKVPDGLTDYERERQRVIQANRERMMQLKLPDMAAPLAEKEARQKAPTKRGITGKRRQDDNKEPQVLRRSSRQRGSAPDPVTSQGIDYETAGGHVILSGADPSAAAESEADRLGIDDIEEIPFDSFEGTDETDAAFLAALREAAGAGAEGAADGSREPALRKAFRLEERHARKVVPRGVTVMGFTPAPGGRLLLAAGDKDGHLGLWDAGEPRDGDSRDNDDDDGSAGILFRPHRDFVSGLAWSASGSGLYTAGFDGCLRLLDLERGVFRRCHRSEVADYSAMDCREREGAVRLGDSKGFVRTVDLGSGESGTPARLHDRKINSLQMEPSGRPLMATASTDGDVCVWDVRRMGPKAKPLARLPHRKSCHGAYWDPSDPSGSCCRLATISFDNTVRVYEETLSGDFTRRHVVKHNNNTGRWILPFKPQWSPAGDAIAVGSMQRCVDLICPETGAVEREIREEHLTAIPARIAFHPWRNVMAAATSSGRVHLFT